uniref:TRAF-type domain-containing protein n=1 Tax=Amphimedon queenslandica TaxID=400682 RepID=A0A1X7T182_AMPQE
MKKTANTDQLHALIVALIKALLSKWSPIIKLVVFPVPCTNKDHKGFTIQQKKLQHHLDTDCPFQPIDCQFKWA